MAASLTRREALGGAAAVVLLASCGGDDPPPGGAQPGSGAALMSSLLALQHATVAAYGAGEEVLRGEALAEARAIRAQEREHARRLETAIRDLGGEPPAGKSPEEYARTFPRLKAEADALLFADHLEQRQVRAYLDAVKDFQQAGSRATAAEVGADQAAHLAAVRVLRGLPAAQGPFVTGAL
jgi:Ferritin-like domain